MLRLARIVVATDFSEASAAALAYARELARESDARLHLLHVTEDVALRFTAGPVPGMIPDFQQQVDLAATERLEALITDQERRTHRVLPVIRMSAAPARAIVAYAADVDADLIVMGTHGRGMVAHMLLGSVAERVVRTAPCPVLTVREPVRDIFVHDPMAVAVTA